MMVLHGKSVRHGLIYGSGILKYHPVAKMISMHIYGDLLEYSLTSNKKKTIKETHGPKKKNQLFHLTSC